ncbi:MAG: DUF6056 family protein [Lachnospiraceae bacterium]|nr:DUF6056 family protein [Lachnospiraceae bacterium]
MIKEKRTVDKKKWAHMAVYVLFFITVCILAYQLPYCHDDWHWGLPDRVELMKNLFKNYNGRYLGNITILLITRSTLAKTLIPAFWMVWLLREMDAGIFHALKRKKTGTRFFMLLLTIFLIAALPQTLFVQSYGWFAAFANFVPPVILFLCWFNQTEDLYTENGSREAASCRRLPARKAPLVFLLGLSTQLFSENVTVFAVIYALWLIVYARIRKGRFYASHLAWFAGTVAGAVLMFINGGYRGAVGFKTISLSVAGMYYQLRDQMMDHLFINNVVLNVFIAVVVLCLLIRKGGRSFLDAFASLMVCGFAFYCVWHSFSPDWKFSADEGTNNLIELLFCALFFGSVLISTWRTVDPERRLSICILYLCSAVSAAPLMAASPIGARCFYFNYILQCLTALKLSECLVSGRRISLWYPFLLVSAALAILGGSCIYAFTANGTTEQLRRQLIEEAVESEADEVVLPAMPCPSWCYISEPVNEEWMEHFKNFYGIPQEMTVSFQ